MKKRILIAGILLLTITMTGCSNYSENEDTKNKITECYSKETAEKLDEIYGLETLYGIYSTSSCDALNIRDDNNKTIKISMSNEGKLENIMVDDKYVYNIDKSYDIYEKDLETIKEPANEQLKAERIQLEKIFGYEEGQKNYYLDNEEKIRKFVIEYNKSNDNKVNEVKWEKNHTIARLKFDDMSARVLSNTESGFIVECEFSNGKNQINKYKELLKNISKVLDNNINDEAFNTAFQEADKEQLKDIKITENSFININYNKDAVGFLSADYYFLELKVKNF